MSEMEQLYAEHAQLRAEVARHHRRNHFPSQPPSSANRYAGRPSTSLSAATHFSALTNGTRISANMARTISEPLMGMDIPAIIEEDIAEVERKPAKKVSRPPVLVPGAPATKKIVPPPPSMRGSIYTSRHSQSFTASRDLAYSSDDGGSTESDEVVSQRRDPPVIAVPNYGYVPGVGYVPASLAQGEPRRDSEDGAVGQLVLYTPSQRHDAIPFCPPEHASIASSEEAVRLPGPSWLRTIPSPSSATSMSYTGRSNNNSHFSASSSLSSLGLLAPSPGPQSPPIPTSTRASPEPSIDSWGTVPTAHTPGSTSVWDLQLTGLPALMSDIDLSTEPSTSRNSSFADLRLTRLPDASSVDSFQRERGTLRSQPSGSSVALSVPPRPSSPPAPVVPPRYGDAPPVSTASRQRRSDEFHPSRSEEILTPRAGHIAPEPISLGLSLSTPSHQVRDVHGSDAWYRPPTRNDRDPRDYSHRLHSRTSNVTGHRSRSSSRTRDMGNVDNVHIDIRTRAHRADETGTDRPSASTARGSTFTPHTDRISGPRQLPSAHHQRESHDDHNRQRRHSSLSHSYLNNSTAGEIPDHHSRVTRDHSFNTSDHGPSGPRSPQHETRPSSIYSLRINPGSSAPSSDMLASASSLGLSFVPPAGPGASAATTASGEPSAIRAPRPVNGSHSGSSFFAMFDRRGTL
ncbi:hypothetical protein BDW22DRAFT_1207233 [Trametopsis cervina]|nr:hypothetical protein BDW22DRAFT_1207233 [Trametopsis cervina]